MVSVKDNGSQSKTVIVDIAGIPTQGLVDTGTDITIMGPKHFKKLHCSKHNKEAVQVGR